MHSSNRCVPTGLSDGDSNLALSYSLTISPHLIGGHVHDVEWPARDHRTPFTGTLNYSALLKHFTANCPLIWELSPSRKSEEIQSSLKIWKQKFPERC